MRQQIERLAGLVHALRAGPRSSSEGQRGRLPATLAPPAPQHPATVPNWAVDDQETAEQRQRRRYRERVDDAISAAQERGEFDNLRGHGKPIPPELLASGDDAWLAGKTLSNAGFLPPWLQLQQELDADLADCLRLVERTERFPPMANRERPLRELQQRLDDLHAKTRRFNLQAPTMQLQRPLPNTAPLLERMAQAVGQPAEGRTGESP